MSERVPEQQEGRSWLPPKEEPWALSLVVRVERESAGGPPAHTDVLVAAARAVVALLVDERTTDPEGAFHDAVARWRGQRIRKIGRRARGSRWDRTAELPHVEGRAGTGPVVAQVRAFAPHPRDAAPRLLHDLQVGGLELTDPADRDHGLPEQSCAPAPEARGHDGVTGGAVLTVRLAPGVQMSTGKAVAQVGHAAQLALERLDRGAVAAWLAGAEPDAATGLAVVVLQGAPVLPASRRVDVRDAGYTEVAPGTVTVSAGFE